MMVMIRAEVVARFASREFAGMTAGWEASPGFQGCRGCGCKISATSRGFVTNEARAFWIWPASRGHDDCVSHNSEQGI
jgi:hypothetical protein